MATTLHKHAAARSTPWQSAAKALAVPNFRIFFLGSLLSVPGPWMQLTAQAWLVLQLTDSPLALATVTSLQFLPIMLLSLLGGAMADRFPRRQLMFVTQSIAALQALALGGMMLSGHLVLWHIYVLAATLGIVNALEAPLRQAFISELVDAERLPNAIALGSMVQNLGRIIGPAVGGVAIALFGVASAFFINAATFAGVLLALLLIDGKALHAVTRTAPKGVIFEIGEGLNHALKTPSILFLMIATAFIGLFGQNFTTMVPLVATYLVKTNAAEFGILNSCLGAGSFAAALFLTTRGEPSARRILIAGLSFGIFLIAIGWSTSLVAASVLFFGVGGAAVMFSASVNTSIQLQAPPAMRGRLASMVSLLIVGSSPIGAMTTGALATGFGVGFAIITNGVLCVVGIVLAYAYLRRIRGSTGAFTLNRRWIQPDAATVETLIEPAK